MTRPRKKQQVPERPDVEGARADLARIKRQRPDVDALVDALQRERRLNNFTANVIVSFRGGRTS